MRYSLVGKIITSINQHPYVIQTSEAHPTVKVVCLPRSSKYNGRIVEDSEITVIEQHEGVAPGRTPSFYVSNEKAEVAMSSCSIPEHQKDWEVGSPWEQNNIFLDRMMKGSKGFGTGNTRRINNFRNSQTTIVGCEPSHGISCWSLPDSRVGPIIARYKGNQEYDMIYLLKEQDEIMAISEAMRDSCS